MKTEKVSLNLSPCELGQIDCLVEKGLFDSRSDFLRTAARKFLDGYESELQNFLQPEHLKGESAANFYFAGVASFGKAEAENFIAKKIRVHIRGFGLLSISNKVTPEEISQTVQSCKVYGKILAGQEILDELKKISDNAN